MKHAADSVRTSGTDRRDRGICLSFFTVLPLLSLSPIAPLSFLFIRPATFRPTLSLSLPLYFFPDRTFDSVGLFASLSLSDFPCRFPILSHVGSSLSRPTEHVFVDLFLIGRVLVLNYVCIHVGSPANHYARRSSTTRHRVRLLNFSFAYCERTRERSVALILYPLIPGSSASYPALLNFFIPYHRSNKRSINDYTRIAQAEALLTSRVNSTACVSRKSTLPFRL